MILGPTLSWMVGTHEGNRTALPVAESSKVTEATRYSSKSDQQAVVSQPYCSVTPCSEFQLPV